MVIEQMDKYDVVKLLYTRGYLIRDLNLITEVSLGKISELTKGSKHIINYPVVSRRVSQLSKELQSSGVLDLHELGINLYWYNRLVLGTEQYRILLRQYYAKGHVRDAYALSGVRKRLSLVKANKVHDKVSDIKLAEIQAVGRYTAKVANLRIARYQESLPKESDLDNWYLPPNK